MRVSDTAGRWPKVEQDTSDFRYVRLHGDAELYTSGYGDRALDAWAERIRRWRKDTYVYFMHEDDALGTGWAKRVLELWRERTAA